MLRQSIRPALRAARLPVNRSFSITAIRMGEGDTGAPRPTGSQSGDIWTKKEAAQESYYVKQREMEKLKGLKEKLKKQREHLDEIDAHIDALTKEQSEQK
ncbi:hypothetical protein FQN57_004208 [Myotisia sp. PD_48]|nr:hypothetical protein FQN57_004208 [Myotisia sp. PD_48]